MKGLELAEAFYLEHGEPMLREQFPHLLPLLAVGLFGSGSECFGFDDAISTDHDFEPGFCILLPSEEIVNRKDAFALERAYAKLPREFLGYRRASLSPVGGNRHGVLRMEEFFREKTGSTHGELSLQDWFFVPEQSLAEATNGKVFYDGLGQLTNIRRSLSYFPEDVRLKKLAGNLLLMGQSGQYNFGRCMQRGERAAAGLALGEFVMSALKCIFLLKKHYMPYYKWSFRALRELGVEASLYNGLEYLLTGESTDGTVAQKKAVVEEICSAVAAEARAQLLTDYTGDAMEGYAYSVNDRIEEGEIRNLHVLFAV